jgi:hypothetical protein
MSADKTRHEPDAEALCHAGERPERFANASQAKWSAQGSEETRKLGERLAGDGATAQASGPIPPQPGDRSSRGRQAR